MKTAETKTATPAVQRKADKPFFGKGKDCFFQKKLTIGQVNDPYEKEADAVADKVVQRGSTPEAPQAQPLSQGISPLLQAKCDHCEEKEKQEEGGDKEKLQRKPIFESNAEPPDDEKGMPVQRSCRECEEGDKVLMKPIPGIQRESFDQSPKADGSRTSIVAAAKGEIGKVQARLNDGTGSRIGAERLLEYFHIAAPGVWDDSIISTAGVEMPSWCGIFSVWAHKKAGKDIGTWQMGKGVSAFGTLTPTDTPQPGDIGYIHKTNQHHALVKEVEGDTIHTIDGNSGANREVKENSKPRSAYTLFLTAFGGGGSGNVQTKENTGKGNNNATASSSVESRINSTKGGGQSLPEGTKQEMEQSFGSDFSNVKIHTDTNAAQLSNELQAQAFTHGSNIYFNTGKYDTSSTAGKHLLAHELTHTLQQGASLHKQPLPQVQREPATEEQKKAIRDVLFRHGVAISDEEVQAIHDEHPEGINATADTIFVQVSGSNYSSIAKTSAVRIHSRVPTAPMVELFVFRVGKGRSILVSSIGGQSVLLDAGAGGANRSNSTAARVLATHINNIATAGLAAAPTTIKISHMDADHFNALSSVLNLPQMGNAIVEVTRQQMQQAITQGNWATMNVQIAPNQRIVQLNVQGTGLDVRRSIIGNMEITEYRSEAAHGSLVAPGTTRFNKNNTSPVTVIRDLVSNTTYVATADAPGRLLNDVVNMVGEDAFRRIAGGGQRNLAAVEFPHHGGEVRSGPDVTGMVRFLRLMFEASNGTVNFFAQTSQNFSNSPSASVRCLDTADINVERVLPDPAGNTSVRQVRGNQNRNITLNGNQVSSVMSLGSANSSRVMEAYQMRDRLLTVSENLQQMRTAFSMVPGETERLGAALGNARTQTDTHLTNLNTSLGTFWTELGNAAQSSGMRVSANTTNLQTQVTNLGTTVQGINVEAIEGSMAQIRGDITMMGRIMLNSVNMLDALRLRDLSKMDQLKAEQRQLVNELLRNARAELGKTVFHAEVRSAWESLRTGWNARYVQRVARRMGMSEAHARQIVFRSTLAQSLVRQMQLNELARKAQEGHLPRSGPAPVGTRAGAWIMIGIEVFRLGAEFYESWEAAEAASEARERERRIAGLREVYWWETMGVRPVIKLLDDDNEPINNITNEQAHQIVNEQTPEAQRPEYSRVVVSDVSEQDLQTVVAQFYLRFMTMQDWIEEMGNPDVNDRTTVRSGSAWFIRSGGNWHVKLWNDEEEKYVMYEKTIIQQPLHDLMTHLNASQAEELDRLKEQNQTQGTFTIKDTALLFGQDREAVVYNYAGGANEIDFDSFRPSFIKLDLVHYAHRIVGTMQQVRAANTETYSRLARHYWVRQGALQAGAQGNSYQIFVEPNVNGYAYVNPSHLVQETAPTPPAQRKEQSSETPDVQPGTEEEIRQNAGQGQSMNEETRQQMETAMGADFSKVNIHTDQKAAELNTDLKAKAFTSGNDIYFNAGQYNPGTKEGSHLLAHELTHVMQQNGEETSQVQRDPDPLPVQGACPSYDPNEINKSRTAAGWLPADVTEHTSDKILFADFGNNHSFVKRNALTEPVWLTWKNTFLTDGSYRIKIVGFSDCSGTEAVNIAIRQARSVSVKNAFGSGITPKLSEQAGAPMAETVVGNDTPENRAKNRSVIIQHKQGFFTEPEAIANANDANTAIQAALAALSGSAEAREQNVPAYVAQRGITIEPLTPRHEGTVVTPDLAFFPGTNYAQTFTLPSATRFHIYNSNANVAVQGRNMPDITALATVDQIKERILQAVSQIAHLAGTGAVMAASILEQYKAQFNSWWNIAPYNTMSTELNLALNSFGPRTIRAREIFNKIYAENAAIKADYDNDTGDIKEKIDNYNGPESFNLINSPRLQALRDVFTANVPPVNAAGYAAFKAAVEAASANLDSDDRLAVTASNDWQRLINQYLTEEAKRQEIRQVINTPPAAPAPPPPPPAAPSAGGGRAAREFLNAIRIDGPAAPIAANNASETVTLTPTSTKPNPGLTFDTKLTVTPEARVIGNNISPQSAWAGGSLTGTPFDAQISNVGNVNMNAHLDVLNLPGSITAPAVPDLPFTINDNRQANLISTWTAEFDYSLPGGNGARYDATKTVRYVSGGQQFKVFADLPAGAVNPGLTITVISRLKKGGAEILNNTASPSSFPNNANSSTVIPFNVSAPAAVPAAGEVFDIEIDLVDSTGAVLSTKAVNFTVLPENVYTEADAKRVATEDNTFFHDNSATGLLGMMTAKGGLAARVAAAINTPSANGGITLVPLTARHDSAAYVTAQNRGVPNPSQIGYFVGVDYSHSFPAAGGAAGFRTDNFPDLGAKVIVLNRTHDVVTNAKRSDAELILLLTHEAVHAMDITQHPRNELERYKREFRAYWMDGRFGPPDHPVCPNGVGGCHHALYDPSMPAPGPKSPRARAIFNFMYNEPVTYDYVKPKYDTDAAFRQEVDNYIYPDGINLIASVRLEQLRALIEAYAGADFAALRRQVRQFMALEAPPPAGGVLDDEEKSQIRSSRAWRDLVERKVGPIADRNTLYGDLSIPILP